MKRIYPGELNRLYVAVSEALNRIVAVQERDATMVIREQMPGAKKRTMKKEQ
jgi:hypothetical protein